MKKIKILFLGCENYPEGFMKGVEKLAASCYNLNYFEESTKEYICSIDPCVAVYDKNTCGCLSERFKDDKDIDAVFVGISPDEQEDRIIGRIEAAIFRQISNNAFLDKLLVSYRRELIDRVLDDLGITPCYSGSLYVRHILNCHAFGDIRGFNGICKRIYPETAKELKMPASSVERSIRFVIKHCWEVSDESTREEYFGSLCGSSGSMPGNREFLMMLSDKLNRMYCDERNAFRSELLEPYSISV